MPFAQSALEGIVQLFSADRFIATEIAFEQLRVDLDDLLHDGPVCLLNAGKVGRRPFPREEAINHPSATLGRQIDRQTFRPKRLLQLPKQLRQVDAWLVDLADDDDAVKPALQCRLVHAPGGDTDTRGAVNYDRRGLYGCQRRLRAAEQIRIAGRIEEVYVLALPFKMADGAIGRVLQLL